MNSGAYRLYINISQNIVISVGALGMLEFKKGYYVYTGSAMKNLRQRVKRHNSIEKKLKWHIDFLLASPSVEIIYTELFESISREECRLNMELAILPGSLFPFRRFGSSDCRQCPSHLIKIEKSELIKMGIIKKKRPE